MQEIPFTNQNYFSVPIPKKYNNIDFIQFIWPTDFNKNDYYIAVESLNTASDKFKVIGALDSVLELPHVIFPQDGRILAIPKNPNQTTFISRLTRGAVYQLVPTAQKYSPMRLLTDFGNSAVPPYPS